MSNCEKCNRERPLETVTINQQPIRLCPDCQWEAANLGAIE